MGKKRKKKAGFVVPPGPGRNPAVRPGAGAHATEKEKRAAEKLRREIEEQRRAAPEG